MKEHRRIVIMGAAGRDFHDFLTEFRDDEQKKVVAFTMAGGQNLGETEEGKRSFPVELAGENYDRDIPILPERDLESIIKEKDVDEVVLSYSDLSHIQVMHLASRAISSGADFRLLGADSVMLDSEKPVIAIDAVRTGCGKSQVSLKVAEELEDMGYTPTVVREPMPYGDLVEQESLVFESLEDLEEFGATIEEREEYEPHIEAGRPVLSGVNYQKVLEKSEEMGDIIIWEGGNNELPFFRPDIHFVLVDSLRQGDETEYHPGESNLRMADYIIVNKENSATDEQIEKVVENSSETNPEAEILHMDSVVDVEDGEDMKDMRVLVVEDGPTLTHGGTSYGAGRIAAEKYGAEILEPGQYLRGSLKKVMEKYSHIEDVIPAMGYSEDQLRDLQETINRSDADGVVLGTPSDISRFLDIEKKVFRARYHVKEKGKTLREILEEEL